MTAPDLTIEEVEQLAGNVCDPELPPLTLADLGILRSVARDGSATVVTVTPTYSGCPAVEFIEDEIRRVLANAGCADVRVERAFSPTWTTDWITAEGRHKLTEAGIAPPRSIARAEVAVTLGGHVRHPVPCPRCRSERTLEISRFGSTACKSLHRCEDCSEPFDHFKEI